MLRTPQTRSRSRMQSKPGTFSKEKEMTLELHHGHFPPLRLEAVRLQSPYMASEIMNKPCHCW